MADTHTQKRSQKKKIKGVRDKSFSKKSYMPNTDHSCMRRSARQISAFFKKKYACLQNIATSQNLLLDVKY